MGLVIAALTATAADLPWRFDGDVTRDAASSVAVTAAVSAPPVCVAVAGAALAEIFDSSDGFSWWASDPLASFDSRPSSGFFLILR